MRSSTPTTCSAPAESPFVKILIAPDKFKESLSALQVADAIEAGLREVFPEADIRKLPVADGGDGTVRALVDALGGRLVEVEATGPLGAPVRAAYGRCGDLAVIEMAAASGLALLAPEERDPLRATSAGTGELIRHALDAGARRFLLGVGGSATVDGGAGVLQALGARLLDARGVDLAPGGAALARLARIDLHGLDPRIATSRFEVACDVDNPLTGPRGAAAVFGPQKGATPEAVGLLEAALAHYAAVIERGFGEAVADLPGAGAGGGIAAALRVFLRAALRPGIDIVADALGLDAAVRDADLVVTGEGRIDGQTAGGKAPVGVARIAGLYGKPVIAIGGSLAPDAAAVHGAGIAAVFAAVGRPCTLAEALFEAEANLRAAARNVGAALQVGARLGAAVDTPLTPDGRATPAPR
jgi:glycerate kinase